MPELPEVETVKNTLAKIIPGKKITNVAIHYAGVIKKPDVDNFVKLLIGKSITSITRRGKYLLFDIEGTLTLAVHLRMTGRLVYTTNIQEDKHIHVVITFSDGTFLYYKDLRKFGTLYLVPPQELNNIRGYAILGPEPLLDGFSLENFSSKLKKSRKKIKQLLLDQELVAGIGNIYADEILHEVAIHPERIALTLTDLEITLLHEGIKKILAAGIEHGGTSFRDYVDGFGEKGKHQEHLKVYQKLNNTCSRCGDKIARIKVSGRSSYHCPNCQK